MIQRKGDKWTLYNHRGKKMGTFKSEKAVHKRERQVNFFKHKRMGGY